MILLALGFFGGIVLTAAAVLIPGRLLSVPEPDDTGDNVDPGDRSDVGGDGHG